MNAHLVLDKAGRVVIPKPVREELHLEPGDALQMDTTGEHITLRPVRGTGPLAKEHGVWVFRTGRPLSASATEDLLQHGCVTQICSAEWPIIHISLASSAMK